VSKQTVGLLDVCTLKNGQEEEGESAQRDTPSSADVYTVFPCIGCYLLQWYKFDYD